MRSRRRAGANPGDAEDVFLTASVALVSNTGTTRLRVPVTDYSFSSTQLDFGNVRPGENSEVELTLTDGAGGTIQIGAEHASRLNQFRESTWSTRRVKVQFLKPDVALVHVDWAIQGDKDPDGTPRSPRSGVFTWVVVKQRDGWLIRAAQNTNQGNLAPQPATAK